MKHVVFGFALLVMRVRPADACSEEGPRMGTMSSIVAEHPFFDSYEHL